MTNQLQNAFRSLSALPEDVQDELGRRLIEYASKWQQMKAGIDRATEELERGEGIEISDIDAALDNLTGKHGRS